MTAASGCGVTSRRYFSDGFPPGCLPLLSELPAPYLSLPPVTLPLFGATAGLSTLAPEPARDGGRSLPATIQASLYVRVVSRK
jgi:hypothetical protein